MEAKSGTGRRFDVQGYQAIDRSVLETLAYEHPGQTINVSLIHPEFTSVCPWTGLPDFAEIIIDYIPREKLVEMKSLKYYLLSYRDVGILQEHATARILNDLVELLTPVYMKVTGKFNSRGGIGTTVTAEHGSAGAQDG